MGGLGGGPSGQRGWRDEHGGRGAQHVHAWPRYLLHVVKMGWRNLGETSGYRRGMSGNVSMERLTNMLSLFHYLIHEPNNQWVEMEDAC